MELGNMSNRQKLILEAVRKMDRAQALFTEGKLEFEHLTGEAKNADGSKSVAGGRQVTEKVKDLLPKKAKKTLANKVTKKLSSQALRGKRQVEKSDILLADRILKVASKRSDITISWLMKNFHLSFYPLRRVVDKLLKDKLLRVNMIPDKHGFPRPYLALA